MTIDETTQDSIFDNMKGTRDALSVKRVFGASYELDGVTIIPVARVGGGAGGGAGEGTDDENHQGTGFGSGFGFGASPIGIYEVRGDQVEWKPTMDVNRAVRGGQILAGIIALCVTAIILRRSSSS